MRAHNKSPHSLAKNPNSSPDYARIINEQHTVRLKNIIDAHKSDVFCGGTVDVAKRYVAPTVLKDVKWDSEVMRDEIFGPILPVLEYDDVERVIAMINARPKPLALYVFSSDDKLIRNVTTKTSSGGVSINDVMMHFVNTAMPFGGVGTSGMGSYHHKHGFITFSHAKSVLHKSRWMDAPIRYPPYTDTNYKVFRYAASIYRINSDSFKTLFWTVFFPIIIGAVAHLSGLTVGFQSRL